MISIDTPKMALSMAPTVKLVCSAMLANKMKRKPSQSLENATFLKRNETKTKQTKKKEKKKKKKKC